MIRTSVTDWAFSCSARGSGYGRTGFETEAAAMEAAVEFAKEHHGVEPAYPVLLTVGRGASDPVWSCRWPQTTWTIGGLLDPLTPGTNRQAKERLG